MAIAWPREDEVLSFPVQCETDPTGLDGVVVYGDLSNPIHAVHCVPSPTDLNEVVVYDHSSYPIPSDCPREEEELPFPVQCETDPTGSDGVVVYGDLSNPIHAVHCVPSPTDLNEVVVYDHSSYPIPSDCPREEEELPFPVQCETDPTGSDGVVVYGDLSNPIHAVHCVPSPTDLNEVVVYDHSSYPIPSDCPREEEELPFPVQCETDPTGSDGVVVYGDLSNPIHAVENHQPRDRASSVDNPSDVRGGLEQQWSSEENHNQEEKLLFRPLGHLAPGGVPVTWCRCGEYGPGLAMILTVVITLVILFLV